MWMCVALVTVFPVLGGVPPGPKLDRSFPVTGIPPINQLQKKSSLEELMREAEADRYAIRRVEFCCGLRTDVYLLTRKSLLVEGEMFKREVLTRGLKSLGGLKSIGPVRLRDVEVRLDREHQEVDFVIHLKERRRRH